MTGKIGIRPIAAADRAAWEPLWHAYLTFYESSVPPEVTDETWRRLMADDEDPSGFVAEDGNGRIIGMTHYLYHRSSWSIEPRCYLQDLYVDPSVRGGGVGAALIKAVYGAADEAGAGQVYWLTQDFNHAARRLYDHIGRLTPFIKYQR